MIQDEVYVKLSLNNNNDDVQSVAPVDNENLTREDLKYSVKIFLRLLDPRLLQQTIETSW